MNIYSIYLLKELEGIKKAYYEGVTRKLGILFLSLVLRFNYFCFALSFQRRSKRSCYK